MVMRCNQQQETLAAARVLRTILAREAQRRVLRGNWNLNELLTAAVASAEADAHRATAALREGVDTELFLWYHLQERLAELRAAEPTTADLYAYAPHVQDYLAHQLDTLRLQEQVQRHPNEDYTARFDDLRRAAGRVPL
jgi:hypothetical protein